MLYRVNLKIIMRGTRQKRVRAVSFPFNKILKCKLICNDRKQINDCWSCREKRRGMFIILMAAID